MVLVALVVWALLSLTIGYWWRKETTIGVPVHGVTGVWALEALSDLPDFLYFLVAGATLVYLSGSSRTIWWSVSLGCTAMAAKALARAHTGHGLIYAGLLFVDLVMPALFAIVGAVAMRTALNRAVSRHAI